MDCVISLGCWLLVPGYGLIYLGILGGLSSGCGPVLIGRVAFWPV